MYQAGTRSLRASTPSTTQTLPAFLDRQDREGWGEWYLAIYGALQALVLQQDAVRQLAVALALPYEPGCKLLDIREVRNDAVGHPTGRGAAPGKTFTALSRVSLSREGFDMLTTERSTVQHQMRRVNLPDLIQSQQSVMGANLGEMLKQLRERERE